MSSRIIVTVSIMAALASLSLLAADKHPDKRPDKQIGLSINMNHDLHMSNSTQPIESGQSAFAALIEMVDLLERNTETDWNKIDIDGFRSHLVDMDHLILETEATKVIVGDKQIRFDIHGAERSVPSIHRMVPAHSRYIQQSRGWIIEPVLNDTGATLTIVVENETDLNRLNSLGFYGFMSLDSHHQAHHYQMAVGNSH